MKTFLAFAAAFGLSVSAASAECTWHSKVSASVDTQTRTASVAKSNMSSIEETKTVKKEVLEKTE